MFSIRLFLSWIAGTLAIAGSLWTRRHEIKSARPLEKLTTLGPVFFAAGIAVFGVVHFVRTQAVVQIVPAWLPARLFWTYFFGVAQLAASISIVLKRYTRLSAPLLAVML